MADVDLIPAGYRNLQLARRRAKQLLIACVSVAVAVGAARLTLNGATALEKQKIAALQKAGVLSTRSKAEADGYRQKMLLVEKQLTELDELRGRDRLKLLLHAIDAAYSDSVWLNELRLIRRDRPSGGNTSALPGGGRTGIIVVPKQNDAAPAPEIAPTAQRVEMIGHASNHTRLAEFMRRLSSQPGIADVRLLDTAAASYMNSPVIALTLTLLVDDKLRKPL